MDDDDYSIDFETENLRALIRAARAQRSFYARTNIARIAEIRLWCVETYPDCRVSDIFFNCFTVRFRRVTDLVYFKLRWWP